MGGKKKLPEKSSRKRPHPLLAFFVYLVIGTLPVGGCIGMMAAPEAAALPVMVVLAIALLAGSGWVVLNFREAIRWLWRNL